MQKKLAFALFFALSASVAQAHEGHDHNHATATTVVEVVEAPTAMPTEPIIKDEAATIESAPVVASSSQTCQPVTEKEIASLFDRWNNTLQYGSPSQVARNYIDGGVLLPTVSNRPRVTREGIEDYFVHFQSKKPAGTINSRTIRIGCNMAIDMGIYTFNYGKGGSTTGRYTYVYEYDKASNKWLIANHHSSALPQDVSTEGFENF